MNPKSETTTPPTDGTQNQGEGDREAARGKPSAPSGDRINASASQRACLVGLSRMARSETITRADINPALNAAVAQYVLILFIEQVFDPPEKLPAVVQLIAGG